METLAAEAPGLVGRSLLPVARDGRVVGTAVVVNYLITAEPDGDVVAQFLATTLAVAEGDRAALGLPEWMTTPPGTASEQLLFPTWSQLWRRPDPHNVDLALLPFVTLREHGHSKGWEWDTQEVTDGMLLTPGETLSVLSDEVAAYGFAEGDDSDLGQRAPVLAPVEPGARPDGSVGFRVDASLLPGALIVALSPTSEGFARFVVAGLLGAAEGDLPRQFTPGTEIRFGAASLVELRRRA